MDVNDNIPGPFAQQRTLQCWRFGRESVSFSEITGIRLIWFRRVRQFLQEDTSTLGRSPIPSWILPGSAFWVQTGGHLLGLSHRPNDEGTGFNDSTRRVDTANVLDEGVGDWAEAWKVNSSYLEKWTNGKDEPSKEWANQRDSERTEERTTGRTNEQTEERTEEQKEERKEERTNGGTNEETEGQNKRKNERKNEPKNKRKNEQTGERINGRIRPNRERPNKRKNEQTEEQTEEQKEELTEERTDERGKDHTDLVSGVAGVWVFHLDHDEGVQEVGPDGDWGERRVLFLEWRQTANQWLDPAGNQYSLYPWLPSHPSFHHILNSTTSLLFPFLVLFRFPVPISPTPSFLLQKYFEAPSPHFFLFFFLRSHSTTTNKQLVTKSKRHELTWKTIDTISLPICLFLCTWIG